MADRQKVFLWQVIRLLKNYGYFWHEFTEKRLRNPAEHGFNMIHLEFIG